MLGLTASVTAFADTFAPNDPTPSTINVVASGEPSPQSIADSAFGPGHINVDTGQSSAGLFSSTTPYFATSVPTLIAEFTATANSQSFGIWFGTDTNNKVQYDILLGGAISHSFVGIGIDNGTLEISSGAGCGSKYNCGTFSNALINPNAFGFFFKPVADGSDLLLARPAQYRPSRGEVRRLPGRRHEQLAVRPRRRRCGEGRFRLQRHGGQGRVDHRRARARDYALMLAGLGAVGFVARRRKSR